VLEQQGRACLHEDPPVDLGYVVDDRDRLLDVSDAAGAREVTQEGSKIAERRQTAHSTQNSPLSPDTTLTEDKAIAAAAMHGFAMNRPRPAPQIPVAVRLGLWPFPLALVELALHRLVRSIADRHPSMFARLGAHAGKRFVLAPTDLPLVVAMTLDPDEPAVSVTPPRRPVAADARVAGPLAALLGLAQGRYDGDALFFSGDITVEGGTEIILALHNAVDDAEIDLLQESAALFGPLSGLLERLLRPTAPLIERYTGLAVTRGQPAAL
jgi:predicted lipid carrier protein YhbT